ncbi:hypothetical protein COB64_00185 [Candidatus Wolfebacteria bacterium]|nr:MAG: hypothetical protein COB64_00185 [Candidatus Wolfebacteria bacterium]
MKAHIDNAIITIVDDQSPEEIAMVQALNSRSSGGYLVNHAKVLKQGFENFMKGTYVGYGHKSIGDCGTTTICADGISMLCAKAIQDWFLYSGQETSTRFIDVSGLGFIDPVNTAASQAIMNAWFDFYLNENKSLIVHLKKLRPLREGEDEGKYEKTIEKRALDVLRSFLPAGAKTNASWHTNLRQAADHLALMNYHPADEIRIVAKKMLAGLVGKYPNSFSHKSYPETERYREEIMSKHNYFNPDSFSNFSFAVNFLKRDIIDEFCWAIENRPEKTELPKIVNEAGSFTFDFLLDFGSYRDWQRHRSALQRMPLLTEKFGFGQWYLNQMPNDMKVRATTLIKKQVTAVEKLGVSEETRQYYLAMGFQVPCRSTVSISDIVYIVELRSDTTVHPTVREKAHKIYDVVNAQIPGLIKYANLTKDDFDLKRADQDITQRESV